MTCASTLDTRLPGVEVFAGVGGLALATRTWMRKVLFVEIDSNCTRVPLYTRTLHARIEL